MKPASIVLVTALTLVLGGCSTLDDAPDPMGEGAEEGRIEFSRTTAFDGDKLTVFVRNRERDGRQLHLNTVRDVAETRIESTRLPNHSARSWVLENSAQDSRSQVYALVAWNNDDPTSYLAVGWWLHQSDDADDLERVIFTDGPEIDSGANPPEMPITGQAHYGGVAGGIFFYEFGSEWDEREGGYTYDEFRGWMNVVADFDSGTLSGCLGCVGDLRRNRQHLEYRFDRISEDYLPDVPPPLEGYEVHFNPVAYNEDGTFETAFDSAAGTMRHPERNVTESRAFWGGGISNIDDADGNPRLVSGFIDAEFEEEDGSNGFLWGIFNVLSDTLTEEPQAADEPDE